MYICIFVFIENPFYNLLTNKTLYVPLASSPLISIIVAINSDGTKNHQDDITDSLVLARPNDEDFFGEFEQDSTNFQLYHYMFTPLKRQNMGQYIIYSGKKSVFILHCTYSCIVSYSELNDEQLLNVSIEVNITIKGDIHMYICPTNLVTYVCTYVHIYNMNVFATCITMFLFSSF